ncbi:hypothetical protein WDZ92_33640 [Nostoc sp. NIES-2111]
MSQAIIQLAGNLRNQPAIPLSASAEIADFAEVKLVFAWVRSPNVPLILGQFKILNSKLIRLCLKSDGDRLKWLLSALSSLWVKYNKKQITWL